MPRAFHRNQSGMTAHAKGSAGGTSVGCQHLPSSSQRHHSMGEASPLSLADQLNNFERSTRGSERLATAHLSEASARSALEGRRSARGVA